MPPRSTVGAPGTQGVIVFGMQGMGVNTPSAAAVAAATVGFASELHIPNGKIFTRGLWSMIFASGVLVNTLFCGSTISELGATPKVHWSIAPIQTCIAIFTSIFLVGYWLLETAELITACPPRCLAGSLITDYQSSVIIRLPVTNLSQIREYGRSPVFWTQILTETKIIHRKDAENAKKE